VCGCYLISCNIPCCVGALLHLLLLLCCRTSTSERPAKAYAVVVFGTGAIHVVPACWTCGPDVCEWPRDESKLDAFVAAGEPISDMCTLERCIVMIGSSK